MYRAGKLWPYPSHSQSSIEILKSIVFTVEACLGYPVITPAQLANSIQFNPIGPCPRPEIMSLYSSKVKWCTFLNWDCWAHAFLRKGHSDSEFRLVGEHGGIFVPWWWIGLRRHSILTRKRNSLHFKGFNGCFEGIAGSDLVPCCFFVFFLIFNLFQLSKDSARHVDQHMDNEGCHLPKIFKM